MKEKLIFGLKNKDILIQKKSSSGGVVHSIAKKIIENNGCVFSADYDYESHCVKFSCINDINGLDTIKGSKYIQAQTIGLYKNVEKTITSKKFEQVLFIGLACQCYALKQYLKIKKIDTSNLIIIDIICHGVGSPKIWKEYIMNVEKKNKDKIFFVSFKDKRFGWLLPYSVAKSDKKEYSIANYTSLYNRALIIRPSCYNCKFCNTERVGDLTVGDFWSIKEVNNEFYDSNGVSSIMVNTIKGAKLFDSIKNDFYTFKTNLESILQPNLIKATCEPYNRHIFWLDYYKKGLKFVLKKYVCTHFVSKVKRYIYRRMGIWKI